MTLSGAATLGKNGPGSNGNKGVLCIPQNSSITGASPSNCLESYPGYSFGVALPLCWDTVSVFYCPSRRGFVVLGPKIPTIIGISVTFMFHSIFSSLARSKYLFICSSFFYFYIKPCWDAMYLVTSSFLNLDKLKFGLLGGAGWYNDEVWWD